MNSIVDIKNRVWMAILLLPLLLTGCNGYEMDDSRGEGNHNPRYITVTAEMAGVPETRGTPINSVVQMTDFGFFCSYTGQNTWNIATHTPEKMYNEKMIRNTTTGFWDYASGNGIEWDNASAADNYTFFAYAPFASATNGITVISAATDAGVPRLSYKVPQNVTHQPDLMIAGAKKNMHPTGHPVNLQMKHALTAVGFLVSGNGEVITGISITGVVDSAVLTMDADLPDFWSDLGSPITSELSVSIAGGSFIANAVPTDPLASDGYLMMIPQTLTPNALVKVTFSNNIVKYLELFDATPVWEAGKRIIYSINLAKP